MSALADRLRGVVTPSAGSRPRPVSGDGRVRPSGHGAIADVLGGEWHDADDPRVLVVDRTYRPGHRHGEVPIADAMPPADGVWRDLSLLLGGTERGQPAAPLLFLDLETTGLAGGAGTYAFLVGCAWFDGGVFRIRQFVLAAFSGEPALLDAVTALAARVGTVVTYNGKSFDLPLLDTRYILHRRETPFGGMPHVDMLHPSRRLWRGDDEGCRLAALERAFCGELREDDVPGFEIPARYFDYVRTGEARPLAGVLEHNRLDLLSLACVTARAARLLDEGPAATRDAREALGLGRLYARGGRLTEAMTCFRRAADDEEGDPVIRVDALRAHAQVSRRLRRHDEAAWAWRRILDVSGCPAGVACEATEALAVHHEHRMRDPDTAREFALRALEREGRAGRIEALQYRLARLDRKLGLF